MSGAHPKKTTCPQCGKPFPPHTPADHPSAENRAFKNNSRTLSLAALMLCSGVFWTLGRRSGASAAGQSITGSNFSGMQSEVLSYITGTGADKSCNACLTSANNFLKEKKAAELREKTKDMARLPAGEYFTGSPDGTGDPDEHPRHNVYLNAFYIDKHETTIGDYTRFVKDTSGNYPEWAKPEGKFNIDTGKEDYYKRLYSLLKTCETCPVVGVTAQNAQAYCASKNRRLPTEAEWEAAARAGSETAFSFGGNSVPAGDYAWYEGNSGAKPHPVGEKKPNPLGLYDIHGNVWEWTSDYYEKWYYQKSPNRDPRGPEKAEERVIRGGSWAFDADAARSANRASNDRSNDDIGFRCAVSENELSAGKENASDLAIEK